MWGGDGVERGSCGMWVECGGGGGVGEGKEDVGWSVGVGEMVEDGGERGGV